MNQTEQYIKITIIYTLRCYNALYLQLNNSHHNWRTVQIR